MCYEENFDRGFLFDWKIQFLPWLEIIVVSMWLKPVTKKIYAFNVESQHHNDDGLIGAMKLILVNQNNTTANFWSKQWKKIIMILFILYDTSNNVYIDIWWYQL